MLAAQVEDMINTVVRQIAFYTFETEAPSLHLERKSGKLMIEAILSRYFASWKMMPRMYL